jgi:NADH-quinone oxidoreductase subunit A
MPLFTAYLLVFLVVGVFFIFFHLMLGKIVRPARPDAEKLTIYECGEPTIGSSWIQFDLRFYVVALLFVIFDVEVVFFFPWAVVFGKATALGQTDQPDRAQLSQELVPAEMRLLPPIRGQQNQPGQQLAAANEPIAVDGARSLAWLAFWDILVFFGVLLVGFAYLWKRGDLDWVRSTMAEESPAALPEPPGSALAARAEQRELVGAGHTAPH